jgi:hypothetical protein
MKVIASLEELHRHIVPYALPTQDSLPAAYVLSFYFKISVHHATSVLVRLRYEMGRQPAGATSFAFVEVPRMPLCVACSDIPTLTACIGETVRLALSDDERTKRIR